MKGLPREARPIWAELTASPVSDVASLRAELADYRERIQGEAGRRELFDHARGLRVAESCAALLDRWGTLSGDDQRIAQAAVRYFLRQRDGEDDFESVTGFDDDAAVMNAALEHLGFDVLGIDRTRRH